MANKEGDLFHAPISLAAEMLGKQTEFFLDQMRGTARKPAKIADMEAEPLIQEIAALVPPTEEVAGG